MDIYINKKYHIEKINKYEELEFFIEEINNRDIDLINVIKDENGYVVIYKSNKEISYEIR